MRGVALYARVSILNNSQSPEMQLRELREYVERRGWTLAGEYVDEGISGAKDSRPELNRLMEDAHNRGSWFLRTGTALTPLFIPVRCLN